MTDASDDESLVALEAEFGLVGYARWWKILEIIARQMKAKTDVPSVTYSWAKWESYLLAKRKLLVSYLLASQKLGLINFEANGELVRISAPKLLKYRDEYARKSGHKSGQAPVQAPDGVGVTETETENRENLLSEVTSDGEKFSTDSVPYRLSLLLLEKIRSNDSKFKEPNLGRWADAIDKLIRIDKRDPGEVAKVIAWCQSHSFWQSNILSATKLRSQYTQLRLKREAEKKTASKPRTAAPLQVE